jgi:transposase
LFFSLTGQTGVAAQICSTGVFGEAAKAMPGSMIDVKTLHAKLGELTLENDFLSGALGKAGLLLSAKK